MEFKSLPVVYLEAYYRPSERVSSTMWDDGISLCYKNTAAHPVLYKMLCEGDRLYVGAVCTQFVLIKDNFMFCHF